MKKFSIATLITISFLLSANLIGFRAVGSLGNYPTAESQSLLASLSPPNPAIGDDITWLIWTDPNCSGQSVHLTIYDTTNDSIVYEADANLGTLNRCGSLTKVISTVGFQEHKYQFIAKMVLGDMKIECSRYLDFTPFEFALFAYTSPYIAIPGENVKLIILELIYPYVDALANVRVYNKTNPSLWTMSDIVIPSTNGSRWIDIPTTGLVAGSYFVNVTATSSVGPGSTVTSFELTDIIVNVDKYSYCIGEMVNVSARTYPTLTKAGVEIYSWFPIPVDIHDELTLTNGQGYKLYDSSGWPPQFFVVKCNVTIGIEEALGFAYFNMYPFDVSVQFDKFTYVAGEIVNITISTTLPQPNAEFNLTITNSTGAEIWSFGPSNLDINGETWKTFDTTGLPPGYYGVEAIVNNSIYQESGYNIFNVVKSVFSIFADIEPHSNTGYAMPRLNITVVPEQKNANLTIEVYTYSNTYYTFTKNDFDISTYIYFIPAVGMPNETYVGVSIEVTSADPTNSTWSSFNYSNGLDTDGDGLTDSQEQTIYSTSITNPDTDGDGFFDGFEVYHGSDPLDPGSIIPEQVLIPSVTILFIATAFSLKKTKLYKRKTNQ